MDYKELRENGLEQIQNLTGNIWTDYNTHDPGVTILEQICYALTDLNYRAAFSIQDLMAEGGRPRHNDTLRPRLMLSSCPVTLEDWRMLLLDINGVENVWIYPVDTTGKEYQPLVYHNAISGTLTLNANDHTSPLILRGLYQIDYVIDQNYSSREAQVTQAINAQFQKHRNLCEDLYQIQRLKEYRVDLVAQIEIDESPNAEAILAQIYARVNAYFRPAIRFYSLEEMLEKGYQMDEVMEGPQLDHGFLDTEELANFGLQQNLRITDINHLIMDIEGVVAVRNLSLLSNEKIIASTRTKDLWEVDVPDGMVANLYVPPKHHKTPSVELWYKGTRVQTDWPQTVNLFRNQIDLNNQKKTEKSITELDRQAPIGRNRQVGLYQSIIPQFPNIYGIGADGLPPNSSYQRIAQAKQLQAYLSFFDQILANAFAQLGGMHTLFGLELANTDNQKTYFSQSLDGESPGFENLVDPTAYQQFLNETGTEEEEAQQRLKRLTQHLLARFAENAIDFAQADLTSENKRQRDFLCEYPDLSYRRFTAIDYTQGNNLKPNIAGLEQRLNYLLGFPQIRPEYLASLTEDHSGAFYMVEHILLRPREEDESQLGPISFLPREESLSRLLPIDPFSLQLSFIFPDWLDRLDETGNEWQFIKKSIREQTPAHLKIYIHRFTQTEMTNFETAYQDWLLQLKSS